MIWLLKDPIDTWTKAMRKMGSDTVTRIFDIIALIDDENKSLKKDHLIQCFLLGKSNTNYLKAITKKTFHPGKQILVRDGKEEKEYLSSNLINQPVAIYKNGERGWLQSIDIVSPDYQFRHAFRHEQDECNVQLDGGNEANFIFFYADQHDFLHTQKESILKEVVNKFISKDKTINDALKEVMLENFGDVLSELQELKEGQNAILGCTKEINDKLDLIMGASQLQKSSQYQKQQNLPNIYIDTHEMVPLKEQDDVAPLDNVTHPGTLAFIIEIYFYYVELKDIFRIFYFTICY